MNESLLYAKASNLAQISVAGVKPSASDARWLSDVRSKKDKGLLSDDEISVVENAFLSHGLSFDWTRQRPGPKSDPVRDDRVREMREAGSSLQEIGDELNVSRQRIHQILKRV